MDAMRRMRFLGFRLSVCRFVLALLAAVGLAACGYGGGGGSYSSINGYVSGLWDFTVTNAKGHVTAVIEANLNQDHHGIISAPASVTATGPAGNVFDMFIFGGSLSTPQGIAPDYLGFTCTGADSGDRSISGSLNSSNQMTLNQNVGGTEVATMTGTLTSLSPPAFSGMLTSSGACGGAGSASVIGVLARPFVGTYTGTSAADNAETITATLADTTGPITGTGTDSKLGNFTLTGNAVGNAFSGTLTYAGSPANSGPVFGYYDPQLGTNGNGSILLLNFQGANTTSCSTGTGPYNGSCQLATLALQ
jgi:hypothetical protein